MRPTLAIISLGLLLALARAPSLAAAAVGIYDTNAPAATALSGSAVADKTGWTLVVEETADPKFRGDTVLANDRLALAFRRGGPGAELYARGPSGVVCRAVLAPAGTNDYPTDPASVESGLTTTRKPEKHRPFRPRRSTTAAAGGGGGAARAERARQGTDVA